MSRSDDDALTTIREAERAPDYFKVVDAVHRVLTPYVLRIGSAEDCLAIAIAVHSVTLEVVCAAMNDEDQRAALTLVLATTPQLFQSVKRQVDKGRSEIEAATANVMGHA